MEGLAGEIEPYGIRTMIVEPGFFRTELLQPESTTFAVEQKARLLLAQVDAHRELSINLAHDDARVAA